MKKLSILASSLLAALLLSSAARAQSGTWTNLGGGSWAAPVNWLNGTIAQGADNTADFSTLSLGADTTVTLDGTWTIGHLFFGDQADAHNWFLNTGAGGPLTLSVSSIPSPIITVNNRTVTIDAVLTGTQGLTMNGYGTLVLVEPIDYEGGTTNNFGTLTLLSSINTTNNFDFAAPLVINFGVVQSAATFNLNVGQNSDEGSTNVLGTGTLSLIGTENGSNSPDLFFGPDAVANDYYGANLDAATLDLGASQRFIFALTEHNAVAEYDPWEDARIDANIVGSGGITYIAQNSWTNSNPMECPLVLAGANTFTGEVEIQRGSIYLFNTNALVQTNKLLMDPAVNNNARFFLYGNGAIVSDLESGGQGNALIANGNTLNYFFQIPPATLTVNQTSNTVFAGVLVDTQDEYDGGPFTSGPLSLDKTGPGTLTLLGANTYSGSTTNEEGELVISAAQTGGGSFSLADGTALGVTNINGNFVTMSDLALGSSADTTLEFTFSGTPVSFESPITTGSLEANGGANSVTINIYVNGTGIPVGQFPLIQYTNGVIGGSGAGFGAFKLGLLPPAVVASLVNDATNNSIDLKVTTGTAAPSENGTWINPGGGSWANAADWQGGNIAHGIGYTADFSTLTLNNDETVTLDGPQVIGNLVFGDQGHAHNWFIENGLVGPLTLRGSSTPSISVNNQTATIGATLAGTQGLTQNGNGTLVLVQPVGYSGSTTNNAGTLELLGNFSTINNSTFAQPLAINAGAVESAATFNLDVDQNNESGSTNVLGNGTLRLVGASNGTNSPDLFFGPDAVANDYYGVNLGAATLDLGASQRYIFALTEHNSVAQYDPWEDARIDSAIIGAGGITYIAQNTYGGSHPMECPLVLAGVNTFTGGVEIQRGSIYLLNPQALVQTNDLLMDPLAGNNARLFLYGNGATVANLQSAGAGSPLIANGNVDNPITIAPATLTVYQTTNTVFGGMLVDGQYEYDAGGNPPGSLSLLKTGPGTLTLTGPNAYTGSTFVEAGLLVVTPAQTNDSAFGVADGAALGIANINDNGLTMSDLALSNSMVDFTFTGNPTPTVAPITTSTLEVYRSANSVTINIAGTSLPAGQYPLLQYTSGSIGGTGAGYGAFQLGTLPLGVVASLVNNTANNSIDLKITTGIGIPSENGAWTNPNGGSWLNAANWQSGAIATGAGFTADFSTLSLSANATVTLDGAQTIGNLVFGDQANAHNWTLNTGSGGPLTLTVPSGTPSITVNNEITSIGLSLVGTEGLNQNGNGTLVLVQPVGYPGGTTNNAGTLALLGSLNTYAATPLSITTEVQSGGTLNLDVNQNGSAASMNVIGGGTLGLIGTNNGPSSPDLYFGPDHVSNDYYGALLEAGTLDLGASQRYIFERSGHNSVSEYLGNEDGRIAGNIIGAGGITYIAQMNWPDMEAPLTLFGANTFTGELEIQRGSIYLMNAQALVQSNKLLLDPTSTNNARFFLYGNGATVANLESSGTGNALIANGNPKNDYFTISPATLTVNQTSNTVFAGVLVDNEAEHDAGTYTSSNLSLVKIGPAKLTLTGSNTYTGSTAVNGGELIVSPIQTGGGSFSVADGAALGITNVSGNALSMSDLALGNTANTTVEFFFGGLPSASVAPVVTSTLEANGGANSVALNVSISPTVASSITNGLYPLIRYSSGSIGGSGSGFGAFHLGTLPSFITASLVNDTTNNSIALSITTTNSTGLPPQVLPVQKLTNGIFSLTITGAVGTGFTVHATTNLSLPVSMWTVVGSGTIGSGPTTFSDSSSTNYVDRYYLISTP
jgi:autotransporter-associated beta strand protein